MENTDSADEQIFSRDPFYTSSDSDSLSLLLKDKYNSSGSDEEDNKNHEDTQDYKDVLSSDSASRAPESQNVDAPEGQNVDVPASLDAPKRAVRPNLSKRVPINENSAKALGVSIEELRDLNNLVYFATNNHIDPKEQCLRSLHISTTFFFTSLQWRQALFETIYNLFSKSNPDIFKLLKKHSNLVDKTFELLSTMLLDLFACIFSEISVSSHAQKLKRRRLRRILTELIQDFPMEECNPTERRYLRRRIRQLRLQIEETLPNIQRLTDADIFRNALTSEWPFHVIRNAQRSLSKQQNLKKKT